MIIADKYYIGSTCQKYLCQRKALHMQHAKRWPTTRVYAYLLEHPDEISIELIEDWPCASKNELNTRENYWIRLSAHDPNCLNTRNAITTLKSVDEAKQRFKIRRSEPVVCECGAEVVRSNLSQHKRMKCHCDALGIPYNETPIRSNESKIRQQQQASARAKEIITCECGARIARGSLYLHKRGKMHVIA